MKTIYQIEAAVLLSGGSAFLGAKIAQLDIPAYIIAALFIGAAVCGLLAQGSEKGSTASEETSAAEGGSSRRPARNRDFVMYDLSKEEDA